MSKKERETRSRRDAPPGAFRAAVSFDIGSILEWMYPTPEEEFRVEVRRPDDLLVFDLVFDNLKLVTGDAPRLERENANAPGVLIVELPPQSFGEEAFLETSRADATAQADPFPETLNDPNSGYQPKNVATSGETPTALPTSRVRMSGRSRLAFTMPAEDDALPFTLPDVLVAMKTWPMRRDPIARPDPVYVAAATGVGTAVAVESTEAAFGKLSEWVGLRAGLVAGLERRGVVGFGEALELSSQRVAEHAAAGLAGDDSCTASALQGAMFRQFERLSREFPDLRAGRARQAALAAMSLATAEHLVAAASRGDLKLDVGDLERLPLFPLLLLPHEPSRDVTALELPYRLILSPVGSGRWTHVVDVADADHDDRVELWHTRLTTAADDFGPDGPGRIRAIWSPDYPASVPELIPLLGKPQDTPPTPPAPFRMSLDPLDRKMLVQLMADWGQQRSDVPRLKYVPRSSRAERLHLSALGALLDAEGNWGIRPEEVDLEQWRHLATLGRDHYVRVVYAGFLCPFGHAASLIKVTERKFEDASDAPGGRVAVLRQRFFIVVRERVRRYNGSGHPHKGRNFPFEHVEILTRVTPDLVEPGAGDSAVNDSTIYLSFAPRMLFWPMVPDGGAGNSGVDFRFDAIATDIDGNRITLDVPLLFVGETVNDGDPEAVRTIYDGEPESKRIADFGGATVTYAPFHQADKGDPRLPTERITLGAGERVAGPTKPKFYPEVASARVGVPALRKLMGQSDALVDVVYPDVFKKFGFGETDASKNKGRVFLHLENPHPLAFGGGGGDSKSDSIGGLASPQMEIRALSKEMGPVAVNPALPPNEADQKLDDVAAGGFDPADFFNDAKILGGVDLGTIVKVATTLTGADVPKMLSRELPDKIEASFTWDTEITQSDPLNLLIPRADTNKPNTKLLMNGTVTTPIANPQDTHYVADASLSNFKVNLFGFVIIWFESLSFNAEKGQKPDVAVDMREGDEAVQFGGPLEFVNELRNLVPSNGFSDPPAISVTPSGISASYSLTLPTVGVGVFTLSNLSLGAGFSLPFDSKPAVVKFNFSEREQPFSLTVSLLGGGGFFAIGLTTRGVTEIEAALEFGAAIAIDLGVASGGVEIKAGVYFHWLEPIPDKGTVELTGYVRLYGELSVLGLISASLTFNLQISYLKDQAAGESLVWGEATLVIEVEVLFFSASVDVHCRREFAGSESDPKFIDLIPEEAVWAQYCDAFAEEAA